MGVAGMLLSILVAGCGAPILRTAPSAPSPADHESSIDPSVRITRTAGLFILPSIDQTITDPATVARLQADIDRLPPFPSGVLSCPIDFDTSYTLIFSIPDQPVLTAVISVKGCKRVTLTDGRPAAR